MNLIHCVPWVIEYYFLLIMRCKFTFSLFQNGDSFVEVPPQPSSSLYRNQNFRKAETKEQNPLEHTSWSYMPCYFVTVSCSLFPVPM